MNALEAAKRPIGWTRPATSSAPCHLLLSDGTVACGATGFSVLNPLVKPWRALPCGRCNRSRHLDGRWPGFRVIPPEEQNLSARYAAARPAPATQEPTTIGHLEEEGQAWNVARTAEEIAADRAEVQGYAEAREIIEAQVRAALAIRPEDQAAALGVAALLAAARLKEVEAQRDALADALEMILATDGSKGTFDASGLYAAHGTAVAALRAAGRLP